MPEKSIRDICIEVMNQEGIRNNKERFNAHIYSDVWSCARCHLAYMLAPAIRDYYLGKLPKENLPPSGGLEDKYGYLAGQRKGYNQAIAEIRKAIEDIY